MTGPSLHKENTYIKEHYFLVWPTLQFCKISR